MTLPRQTLESQADKVLGELHGYVRRQEWQVRDRKFIADLLQEWDEQVTTLLYERTHLKQKCIQLEEVSRLKRWRPTGAIQYLKFLVGVTECPSR